MAATGDEHDGDLERTLARPGGSVPREREATPPPSDSFERTMARPVPKQTPGAYVPAIPNVTIKGTLGTGGQGVVFLGHQEYLDRAVAVKVLHRHVDPSFSRRFQREAKILAGLQHPNIVTCHQAGVTDDDHCYMVMEFIDGPDLYDRVAAQGPMEPDAALRLVRDLAEALQHGLDSSIIHRDVKPQNVLLQEVTSQGRVHLRAKLADLGLARCSEEKSDLPQLTTQGSMMGTPTTMAPEQFDAPDAVDHRADIYGLGCVLFYALTGKSAFDGTTITEIYRKKTARDLPREFAKEALVPEPVQPLLVRLLAAQATARPQTYAEVSEAIDALLAGRPVPRAGRAPAKPRGLALFGGTAVALVLGGAGWAVFGGDAEPVTPTADPGAQGVPTASDPVVRDAPPTPPLDVDAGVDPDGGATPEPDTDKGLDPVAPPPVEPTVAALPFLPSLEKGKKKRPLDARDEASMLAEWTRPAGAPPFGSLGLDDPYSAPRIATAPSEEPRGADRLLYDGQWKFTGELGIGLAGRGHTEIASSIELVGPEPPVLAVELHVEIAGHGELRLVIDEGGSRRTLGSTPVDVDLLALEDAASARVSITREADRFVVTLDGNDPIEVDEAALGAPLDSLNRIRIRAIEGIGRWSAFEFVGR